MATVKLNNEPEQILTGNDNIVIVDVINTVRGGRSLDVEGFAPKVINAGHPIIVQTSTQEYKPMPVNANGDAYASLPAGHTYAGILIATIPTNKAFAAILVRGTVNPEASTIPMTSILTALKSALPLIDFRAD